MKKIQLLIAVFLLTATFGYGQSNWKIDASHSNVIFTVSHMVVSEVSGYFKIFEGAVSAKDDLFKDAKITFSADAASINTDNEKRDEHLKSDDFFSTAKYPKITFVSKSFKKVKNNKYKLTGDFTMKGVTKQITLDVTYNGTVKDPWGNTRAGFKLSGELNRFDYNLKWNNVVEAGGAVVGKTVTIKCNIELVKNK